MADRGHEHPVIEYAKRARAQLLAREEKRTKRIVKAYLAAYGRLKTHIKNLEDEYVAEAELVSRDGWIFPC